MTIELRCDTELHGKLNPDRAVVSIKCKGCSRAAGRPVFHHFPITDIIARHQRGDVTGVVRPEDPHFVHWIVKTAA